MSHETRLLLAHKIRYLRRIRGWSQEALAEASNLHRTYIGAVERCERNISLDNLAKVATALDTDIATLFTATEIGYSSRYRIREITTCYKSFIPANGGNNWHQPSQISV
ncbi:MAG: helix-turn-helix transcriptional regulator [Gammaproteobacteria bacterium]